MNIPPDEFYRRLTAARESHDVIPGINLAFEWHLCGAAGAGFVLLAEECHDAVHLRKAKSYLRNNRDVVSIETVRANLPRVQ